MKRMLDLVKRFYNSLWYPILIAFLVFLGHATGLDILFCGVVVFAFLIGCLFCTDLRFALSPVLCLFFIVTIEHGPNVPYYSTYYAQPHVIAVLGAYVLFALAGLVFFAIRNRSTAKKPKLTPVLIGMLILCATLCTNGLFSANYTAGNLLYAITFLPTLIGIYLLFSAYLHFDKRLLDYFAFCLTVAGLLICAEVLFAYLTTVQYVNGSVVKESVVLGWGVWTTIGGLLCFFMPASFYFAANHKHGWLGLIAGMLQLFCILLSQSRGALLIGAGLFVLCMLLLCFVGKNRKINRLLSLGILILGILGAIVLREKLMSVLQNFINYGFGDNGRFAIWQTGWKHFTECVIFGSGFYDSYVNEEWEMSVVPYFYHNTLIQFLASGGIVGLLGYLAHRTQTLLLIFKHPSVYKAFMGICILGLLLFSMLDVLFFCIYPMIFYSMILLFMEQCETILSENPQ